MTTSPHRTRSWLDVPFSEKDTAKACGARWDPAAKRWYDPSPTTAALQRWAPRPAVPDRLPGEDRQFGSGLFVDMVPRTCWFTNVRTCVSERDWERLRRMILGRADHRCEACGAGEDRKLRRWLEAHERWSYDDNTGTQTLRRLICLCTPCHLVTHLGHATITGRSDEALAHLREVTGMSPSEVSRHVDEAGRLWTERSARHWALDLRILTDAGVTLRRPDGPQQRADTAQRTFAAHRTRAAGGGHTGARPTPLANHADAGPRARPLAMSGAAEAATQSTATTSGRSSSPQTTGDLSHAIAGQGVTQEATRRRMTEGAGADRSWRLGADGEAEVGALLAVLTRRSLWARLRGRRQRWHALHSVPLGDGQGNERGDIDHLLIGPPGIVTINTKHHRTGKLVLDGDQLTVNGRQSDYIPKARREAERTAKLAAAAMQHAPDLPTPPVRPMLVVVGGRLVIRQWATGVSVVMTDRLLHTLQALPEVLTAEDVDRLFELARRADTWNPPSLP